MNKQGFWGLVVASYGFHLRVFKVPDSQVLTCDTAFLCSQLEQTQSFDCQALQSLGRIVVGDWVQVKAQAQGWVVINRQERRNCIQRIGSHQKIKMHCANIDQLVMVIAPVPTTGFYVVDSMLMLCYQQGIRSLLLANKSDLPEFAEWLKTWQQYYQAIDVSIQSFSAKTAQGIDELQQQLVNKLSFFIGSSGVGKSSLLNCLLANDVALTQPISGANLQGQHTTSNSQVYVLPTKDFGNGLLIDSPGIREFSLQDYTDFELVFTDIVQLAKHCKFRNCQHVNEPQCAVLVAIDTGKLAEARWSSFQHFHQLYRQQVTEFGVHN